MTTNFLENWQSTEPQYSIPKSEWGEGEWQNEPDYLKWESNGFECFLYRNRFGSWCGYVVIPKNHPWFHEEYPDIEADVHGGLTFSEGDDNHWIIGFDCAHYRDEQPANTYKIMSYLNKISPGTASESNLKKLKELEERVIGFSFYKNMGFAKRETENLAKQAKEVIAP